MDPFSIFDLDTQLIAEVMQKVDSYFRKGLIYPIQNIETVDISQLGSAIGRLPSIIGKLVVSFENPKSLVRMMPIAPTVRFDPTAYYVITEALGGLGQSLIRWMGEHGAKPLALLSRRNISSVPRAQSSSNR